MALSTTNTPDLTGLRVVVLGSTTGIGRATALSLARAGADVIVHGRTASPAADAVAAEIRGLGRRAEIHPADLSDRGAGDRLVEAAWSTWGGLDAWLQIAGADTLTGSGADLSFDAKLDRLWAVDVVATIRLCRAVGRRMRDQGHGAIVTMGWDQAETGMEGDSGELFAATKGAVMAFTRASPSASPPRSASTPWPPAGSGRPGASRPPPPGKTGPSARPPSAAGAPPRTSRKPPGSWSARRRPS